jgi:hypothetical protein
MPSARPPLLAAVACLLFAACGGPGPSSAASGSTPARAADGVATPRPTVDATAVAVSAALGPWRRVPIVPAPGMARTAEDACRALDGVGTLPLRLTDARGEGLLTLVFADEATTMVCEAAITDTGSATADAREVDGLAGADATADGHLGPHDLERQETGSGARIVLVGRVADVPEIGISFDDATWGKATLADGWYAAWWPQAAAALTVASVDRRSVVIDSFPVVP